MSSTLPTVRPDEREARESPCVHELFERRVEERPDAVALVVGDESLTYRELERARQRPRPSPAQAGRRPRRARRDLHVPLRRHDREPPRGAEGRRRVRADRPRLPQAAARGDAERPRAVAAPHHRRAGAQPARLRERGAVRRPRARGDRRRAHRQPRRRRPGRPLLRDLHVGLDRPGKGRRRLPQGLGQPAHLVRVGVRDHGRRPRARDQLVQLRHHAAEHRHAADRRRAAPPPRLARLRPGADPGGRGTRRDHARQLRAEHLLPADRDGARRVAAAERDQDRVPRRRAHLRVAPAGVGAVARVRDGARQRLRGRGVQRRVLVPPAPRLRALRGDLRADRQADLQHRRAHPRRGPEAGPGGRARRDLHHRHRRRQGLRQRPAADRGEVRAEPVRARDAAVPHRRHGPGAPGRRLRDDRPRRLPGEDPRQPDRPRRRRDQLPLAPARARGGRREPRRSAPATCGSSRTSCPTTCPMPRRTSPGASTR